MKQWELAWPWVWLVILPVVAVLGVLASELMYRGHLLSDPSNLFFGLIIGLVGGIGRFSRLRKTRSQ